MAEATRSQGIGSLGDLAVRPVRVVLLLAAACALAYAGSPFNGFVLDDHPIILGNPLVSGAQPLMDAFAMPYHGDDRPFLVYRPLTTVALALQWAVHGPAAWAFHLGNVLLHLGVTFLVWVLGRLLLPSRPLAALIAALVFAVHPIHTDAVSSIVNRSEILAAGFAVAAFLGFARWHAGRRPLLLVVAGACTLGALLSKESGAPVVGFALLWGLVHRREGRSLSALLAGWALAFALPLAVYAGLRFLAFDGALFVSPVRYFAGIEPERTVWTMLGIGARYMKLMVVPWPLSPDYSFESIPIAPRLLEGWPLAGLIAVPLVLLGTLTLLIVSRRGPGLAAAALGMGWFVLFMAPASNLVPLMIPMAERITYGATVGLFLAFGVGAEALWAWCAGQRGAMTNGFAGIRRIGAILVPGLLALVVATYAGMTIERERAWRDDLTLAADAVSTHPRNALMLANLAGALANRGNLDAGIEAMRRALDVGPSRWPFRVALAEMLHDAGRHHEEAQLLVDGLRLAPEDPEAVRRACTAVAEVRPGILVEDCVQGFPR